MPANLKSAAKHKEEGTFRPNRHGGKVKATPINATPKPPNSLCKAAHGIWQTQVKNVLGMQILSEKDYSALETLCFLLWVQREAMADVVKTGQNIVSPKGVVQRNPSLVTLEKVNQQILQLQKEFGLTPLGAQRIDAPPEIEKQEDPRNSLFGGPSSN